MRRTYSRLERVEIPFRLEIMDFAKSPYPSKNVVFFIFFIFQRYLGTSLNTFLSLWLRSKLACVFIRTIPTISFLGFLKFKFFIQFLDFENHRLDLDNFPSGVLLVNLGTSVNSFLILRLHWKLACVFCGTILNIIFFVFRNSHFLFSFWTLKMVFRTCKIFSLVCSCPA